MQAYHRMGAVFDNEGMYAEAIRKSVEGSLVLHTHHTQHSRSFPFAQGEALAYNCLGIDTFKVTDLMNPYSTIRNIWSWRTALGA